MSRIWSNIELKKIGHLFYGDVLNVSAGGNTDKEGNTYDSYFPNAKSYIISNYGIGTYKGFSGLKNELNIDLEKNLKFEFIADVVFNHTVLEHVFDIHKAFENLCKLSRNVVILVIPFIQCQHETQDFKDYWRMTPTCINKMFEKYGFKTIYQSFNDKCKGVYIFTVAARFDTIYKMPEWDCITNAGSHIP